jgi:hypothetical protein
MSQFVEIEFDCMPLRSVGRMDIPIDASPAFRERCERVKHALDSHGSHNTYFLYNARCTFHLTNAPELGMIEFRFDGTVMTDEADRKTLRSDLRVELVRETCDWLTAPATAWLVEGVSHAVEVEFDRYIEAGDLQQTVARIAKLQAELEDRGGFVGMYL